jgi:ParB family chromosome partitioning protein
MKNYETKMRNIAELKPAGYNPRKITEKEYQKLYKSIEEFGLTQPLMVNMKKGRENTVIGGHQRLKVLKDLGYKEVSCIELDLTAQKEKELNIKMNKTGGEFDMDILLEEFDQEDLKDWGFEDWEFGKSADIDAFLKDSHDEEEEEEEDKVPPKIEVTHTCPKCGHEFK